LTLWGYHSDACFHTIEAFLHAANQVSFSNPGVGNNKVPLPLYSSIGECCETHQVEQESWRGSAAMDRMYLDGGMLAPVKKTSSRVHARVALSIPCYQDACNLTNWPSTDCSLTSTI
jgi:hypothetical protein